MNCVIKLKADVARLKDCEPEQADHICFLHLKEATKDFGRNGEVALKLLDLAEELMK